MAKKSEMMFVCGDCGFESQKWLGRCPGCSAWNTFKEFRPAAAAKGSVAAAYASARGGARGQAGTGAGSAAAGLDPVAGAVALEDLQVREAIRYSAGMAEFDRVLGGGFMAGASLLLGGEPGIGKSTLLSQAAAAVAWAGGTVLYAHGEEAAAQVKLRWERLGLPARNVHVLESGHLDVLRENIERLKPRLVIIDSVQTLFDPGVDSSPGSIQQAKFGVFVLTELCRSLECTLCLVAHVTKEGQIAGPKVLEHMVDTVLYFEQAEGDIRFLRASKNRFGATDELGLFRMDEAGLAEVRDAAELFRQTRDGEAPAGIVVAPAYEGSRSLLVELQALLVPGKTGFTRLFSEKVDQRRVSRIAAILERHAGVSFSDHDIYVHVAGGLRILDIGLDLALAAALYSARTGQPLRGEPAIFGELTLAGEVRKVPKLKKRVLDAVELGCQRVLGPAQGAEADFPPAYSGVRTVRQAIAALFGGKPLG